MVRQLLLGLCALVFFTAVAHAQDEDVLPSLPRLIFLENDGPVTDDPKHLGYAYDQNDLPYPVTWKEVQTQCDACVPLADAYNKTMQSLMNTRYWIAEIEDKKSDIEGSNNSARSHGGTVPPVENTEPGTEQEKQAAAELSYRMRVEDMAGRLPALEAQEESLVSLSDDLLRQLLQCEALTCASERIEPAQKTGAEMPPVNMLPFEWEGPYAGVCEKCAALSEQINELPTLARIATAGLEAVRADLMFAEMELLSIDAEYDDIILKRKIFDTTPDGTEKTDEEIQEEITARDKLQTDYEKKTRRRKEDMEAAMKKAEQDIAKYETDLDAVTRNFEETLKSYEACIATCTAETGDVMGPAKPASDSAPGGPEAAE
jgi:hypothetical protein